VAGLAVAVMARTGWGGLPGLVLPLFAFVSATGFVVANSIAAALGRRPDRAGAVSALVGAAQYGAGIAGSALVGGFADGTPWPDGLGDGRNGAGRCPQRLGVVAILTGSQRAAPYTS
jgi:DHA1 family bicyclomycin/chloramphenicol resistance-like MFS transporter